MLKRIGVVVVWLLATLGTAALTYAAVSQADRAVSDDPAMPVSAADIAARVSTAVTTAPEGSTSTSTTAPVASTTSVATTATAPVTTTTTPAATTTTTAPQSQTEWKTVSGVGVVGVFIDGDEVSLISASPVNPYHAEVEENGPERVEVKFEAESSEYRVRAEVRDGRLVWEVSSGGGDGEGS